MSTPLIALLLWQAGQAVPFNPPQPPPLQIFFWGTHRLLWGSDALGWG